MTGLTNRVTERGALDRLVGAVRAGESRALVVHGDPGVGKSVLLDYLAGQADGCRVARAVGVQSEMELAFAGLHQLCAPMLSRAEHLPVPQRDALHTAFGLAAGPPSDRFFVGLAVLSLLSEAARERPLICLVDDVQWLDRASAQALGFAARRLDADPVGLVFAAREPGADLAGLPDLALEGLLEADAQALLASALAAPLDARVRDLIIAETRGNPLALLELPRGLTPAELAGGFGLPGATPLTGRIEDSFQRQLGALPEQTRRLLQLAAADPSGDRSLVWRAAGRLGIRVQAGTPAVEAGLVEFGSQVRFRHPLVRSAVYRSASFAQRQGLHAALAEVTDPRSDPDRRAWHRAQAAAGPDEEIAAELERSAGRAQSRGGLAAAAAFLERSVLLTADPARQAERILAAAQASMQAGAFSKALDLLETPEDAPFDEFQRARADLLHAQVAFASGPGRDAPRLLFHVARRLEPLNLELARETYLHAWGAAVFAGRAAGAGTLLEISRAAAALPPPADAGSPVGLLLESLARLITDGRAAAAPMLRRATSTFAGAGISVGNVLRWGWMALAATNSLWDDERHRAVVTRQIQVIRDAGALDQLPIYLAAQGTVAAWSGDFAAAESMAAEAHALSEATGTRIAPYGAMLLAALRGSDAAAVPLIEATVGAAASAGQGIGVSYGHWAAAILYNGLGRYAQALEAARQASEEAPGLYVSMWALPELIEAAVRTGDTEAAAGALRQLAQTTQPGGTDFGLGIEARCRALLSDGAAAEDRYREAVGRLSRTPLRPELARSHLLYGEWLRRAGRRVDAREHLRTAHGQFTSIGMTAFAERARHELTATGGKVRRRGAETGTTLTAQEACIARLARDGRTNPEIGAQLFLSARTVEWHLRKIFTRLGIGSRRELRDALARVGEDEQPG